MKTLEMYFQMSLDEESLSTEITFIGLNIEMDLIHVIFSMLFVFKVCITFTTNNFFGGLEFQMNLFHMTCQHIFC